jgi:flagellar hook-associated protein 2
VESSIDAMVTSYNTWRSFYLAQTATSSSTGGASSTATLFGDSTLRNAETSVENALSSLVLGNSLGGIGISLDSNNELTVDSGMLESALQNNLSGVESLFEYSAQVTDSNHLSSGALQLTGHGSASYNGLLTLSLTGATSGGVTVAGLTGAGLVTGDTLLGSTTGALTGIGTHLQGVNLQYSGSTIPVGSTVTYYVSLSQGIADQIYDSAYQVSDPTYGSLSSLISSLQTQDTNLTSQYNALDTRISTYKNYLLDQYGSLEASISMANEQASLMQTLIAYGSSSS